MKISIRWALIAGFLGLIWGTHLITTTSSYMTSQDVLQQHARDIMKNIAELAMEQAQRHLLHAHGAAALTRRLLGSNVVGNRPGQVDALERYLYDQLSVNPHFSGIYVGTPQGNFYDVRHFEKTADGGFRTKIILNADQGKQVRLVYRDAQFRLLSQQDNVSDTYDPRMRPWYRKAVAENEIVWTDPYIFYTSQKPGITIAGPFYDGNGLLRGVVGVDIEIDQLSVFIGNLKIGKHGKAFLLNRNADVVAFGEMEKLKFNETGDANTTRLVKIDELADPHSRKAFKQAQIHTDEDGMLLMQGPRFSRFTHDHSAYHAMFTPFSTPQWPWIIGVYLPEDDYLGAIKANRLNNIMATLAISCIAAVLGLLLARGVIRPIALLGSASRQIKKGLAEPFPQINSNYTEIQDAANAFSEMKTAVERSHKKYLGIFNNIQDVYYEASMKGTIIEISPSIEKLSRYHRKELIGKDLTKLYATPTQRFEFIKKLKESGHLNDYEVAFVDKDGSIIHCALNSSTLRTRSGKPYRIIGSLRDINDRKATEQDLLRYRDHLEDLVEARTLELQQANEDLKGQIGIRLSTEKRLRMSEEKYRTILDTIEEAYFEINTFGILTFVNAAASRIMGYTSDALCGTHFRQFSTNSSTRKIIEIFRRTIQSGGPERIITHPVVTKDGSEKVLDLTAAAIYDSIGNISGFRGLARDVTSKIAAEKEKAKLQSQLNQAQRMEAIGTLAGGIAHDFNNMLMGIMGNVSLLGANIDANSHMTGYLRSIEQCVESGASLTGQLLGFARGGKYRITPIDLNETVQRTADLFGRTKKEIQIKADYQEGIWLVEADQAQIEQVLVNLYVNAWQAMAEDMALSLKTKNVALENRSAEALGLPPGNYAAISVHDRGCGIDPDVIDRIFEPFFTTKQIGRGTGLGLASAFGIIQNHGGMIDVQSHLNQGSVFTIYLPAASRNLSKKPAATPKLAHKGRGTLLVVDDESTVLEVLEAILVELGYQVITANNGYTAIALFEKEMGRIDGVLLDMIMPDMSGRQILTELKKRKPDTRVILSSGYTLEGLGDEYKSVPADGFIQKPYSIDKLARTLRETFHSASPP